jgi:protoporphyrinogen/coproporphyrinogen III oxidase
LTRATPIYEVGHPARAARIAARAAEVGAFAVAGNALQGIGVPACIASGVQAGREVLTRIAATEGPRPGGSGRRESLTARETFPPSI